MAIWSAKIGEDRERASRFDAMLLDAGWTVMRSGNARNRRRSQTAEIAVSGPRLCATPQAWRSQSRCDGTDDIIDTAVDAKTKASITTACSAWSMRLHPVEQAGKNDPTPSSRILTSSSPRVVETVLVWWPLREPL